VVGNSLALFLPGVRWCPKFQGPEGGAGPLQSRWQSGNHQLYEDVPVDHQAADRGSFQGVPQAAKLGDGT
jgi:hypothetical protein